MSSALIYKMRLTAPNKPGTASHNSNYVKYIAEREHVMKLSQESESGLFGRIDGANNDELDVTNTQNYVYGISKAGVTVYNAYISFRPEIAKRLELDSLEKWQNYIKFHIETLMRGYDIPKDRFEYIAAVHDKKGQPHIHISFWDKDPPVTVQFVKKEVSDNVRKKLIHDTFANELSYYYGISNEAMTDAKELVGKEILSRAYEYAMKTEIIYAAHDANLDDYQIEALLKHPSPLNDVYSKYLKHDETSLSDELANCLVEEANIANEKRHKEYSDAFFVDNERKCIVWMYYNPDSNAGGQYVTNIISFDKLAKISSVNRNVDNYFNTQISSMCGVL